MAKIKNKLYSEIEILEDVLNSLNSALPLTNSLVIIQKINEIRQWAWDESAKRESQIDDIFLNTEGDDSDVPF